MVQPTHRPLRIGTEGRVLGARGEAAEEGLDVASLEAWGPGAWRGVPGREASSGHLGTTGDCLWWAKLDELRHSW